MYFHCKVTLHWVSIPLLFISFPGVRHGAISHMCCCERPHEVSGCAHARVLEGWLLAAVLLGQCRAFCSVTTGQMVSNTVYYFAFPPAAWGGFVPLHSHQHLIATDFNIFANLICVKWHDMMSLIYIALVTSDIKSLFLCLLSSVFSLLWLFECWNVNILPIQKYIFIKMGLRYLNTNVKGPTTLPQSTQILSLNSVSINKIANNILMSAMGWIVSPYPPPKSISCSPNSQCSRM